ncbi:MAG: class 1b ribonucleoside-diphosphate reductase subunit beta [Streptococcaceae bacterium]|nr:class 1b ribonucleoside-diphosphate reductase subunit beta [Streptococcaceae bacterium]
MTFKETNHLAEVNNRKALRYAANDWNRLEDPIDKYTWDKLNSQFWLDTRVPVSNDLKDWRELSELERDVYSKVFLGLTLLDTVQSNDGNGIIREYAHTPQEAATLGQIQFMEGVHAKSYSTVFSSLMTTQEIDALYEWGDKDIYLQKKAELIDEVYKAGKLAAFAKQYPDKINFEMSDHDILVAGMRTRIASTFLESGLFYSGFYTPLKYLGGNKMVNAAEIIKLILRDESVHGTYIGYYFQKDFAELSEKDQHELTDWAYNLLYVLYENEVNYIEEIYTEIGWVAEVTTFTEYNMNKALMNLGFDPLFVASTADQVNPVVMNGISTSSSNHDFFSAVGNSYLVGEVSPMTDGDYEIN